MSIVILIAPTAETATAAWATLRQADLADAAPSRREQLTPQQVQQLMLKTVQQRRNTTTPQAAHTTPQGTQIVLEKIWTELATDLVLGNVDHAQFGWCQTLDDHTPAFWQRFDPETRFVLVYEEPTAYAARVIAQDHAQAQDLPGTLQYWHSQHNQLINTFYALGANAMLVHASQMQSATLDLGLTVSADTPQAMAHALPDAQVLTQLLQPIVAANVQMQTLWQELQAAAQGPWQETLPTLQAAHQALVQCLAQQRAMAKAEQHCEHLKQAQQQLQSELTAQTQAHQNEVAAKGDAQKQCDAQKQELVQLRQLHTDAQEEGELLLAQLHLVQEELERYALANGSQQKEIAQLNQTTAVQQSRLLAETQFKQAETRAKQIEAAAKADALKQRDALSQEKNRLQQQLREAQEEGELLLAQLHLVQEELENYFLLYQAQRQEVKTVVDFWQQHPPAEVWLDMRRTPDGTGWYAAEADGRWSGPETESTLSFPPLGAGQYLVELQIADAMAPELVAGLQVTAQLQDGQVLPLDLVHEFGPADQLYPMVSTGLLQLPVTTSAWQLRMTLPSVISPTEHGSTDTRQLGLRLQGVRLNLQHGDPADQAVIEPETLA